MAKLDALIKGSEFEAMLDKFIDDQMLKGGKGVEEMMQDLCGDV